VLAAAPVTGGDHAVATVSALAVVGPDALRWRREWTDVDHGSWDADTATLAVTWIDGGPPTSLALTESASPRFAEAFRERVQASVVHVERMDLPVGEIRAVIRRASDGALFSQLLVTGTRSLTPEQRRAAEALESRARGAVGLTP
jgi:hypothetical protein